MMKHYSVRFTIIHNRGTTTATALSRSVRRAFNKASEKAWDNYETSGATNYADEWVTIFRPDGSFLAQGWNSDFPNR